MRWIVYHDCNARCRHCSYFGSSQQRRESLDEADALAVVAALTDGTVTLAGVQLVGGEPLLWPPLQIVVTRLRRQGVPVEIVTNGLDDDDRLVSLLHQSGAPDVCLSIDGTDAATYGVLRDARRFPRVLSTLDRLARNRPSGTRIRINHVFARGNDQPPSRIIAWFADRGADAVSLAFMGLGGTAVINRDRLALTPAREFDLVEDYLRHLDHYPIPTAFPVPPLVRHAASVRLGRDLSRVYDGCPAVSSDWTITSDGAVDPCQRLTGSSTARRALGARLFPLRDWSMSQILADPSMTAILTRKRSLDAVTHTPCRRCPFLGSWCEPCMVGERSVSPTWTRR